MYVIIAMEGIQLTKTFTEQDSFSKAEETFLRAKFEVQMNGGPSVRILSIRLENAPI